MSLASLPALLVATIIPAGYLSWISKRDFFETRKVRLILICFFWGIAAYALAYLVQSNLIHGGILTKEEVVRYLAPILEEILKGARLNAIASGPRQERRSVRVVFPGPERRSMLAGGI